MAKITTISDKGAALIKHFEGCKLKAYPDPATGGVPWTIGYGNTQYKDGRSVKRGDVITQQQAEEMFADLVNTRYASAVVNLIRTTVNQNQFDALVSFAYNCGIGNLQKSTLLKKVNVNPSDQSIPLQFAKWNKAAGKVMNGLTRRRKAEADMYFSL